MSPTFRAGAKYKESMKEKLGQGLQMQRRRDEEWVSRELSAGGMGSNFRSDTLPPESFGPRSAEPGKDGAFQEVGLGAPPAQTSCLHMSARLSALTYQPCGMSASSPVSHFRRCQGLAVLVVLAANRTSQPDLEVNDM